MQVTVLGAGTGLPAANRSPSGYLVRFNGSHILFDIGAGTLSRLAAIGVSYRELDRIVISHLHSDHILDLVALLQANNATPGWTRTAPLQLLGCRGLQGFVEGIMKLFDGTAPESYQLEIVELDAGRHLYLGFTLEAALTGHTASSLAFRLEAEDRVLVYSGDAIESQALIDLASRADLFICECSFPAGFATGDHLTADGCGRMARTAGVQRLLLTHLYPETGDEQALAQARAVFGGEVIVACDGIAMEIC